MVCRAAVGHRRRLQDLRREFPRPEPSEGDSAGRPAGHREGLLISRLRRWEIPDRPARNGKTIAPGCVQLHQFGTPLTWREPAESNFGAAGLAITLKSRSTTQC